MPKKIVYLLVVSAMLLSLASCGGAAPPASAPAAAEPTKAPAAAEPTKAPAAAATRAPEAAVKPAGKVQDLTIWWAQWDPANYLQEIGKLYEKETGIKVNVVQEPWAATSTGVG